MLLAIDPGRDKVGVALLDKKKKVYLQQIVANSGLKSYLLELIDKFKIERIILGDGTYSEDIQRQLAEGLDLPITLIDESYTTLQAEERYRREHYRGWKGLLKFIKWKPPIPLDDYVAVILAEKYLDECSSQL